MKVEFVNATKEFVERGSREKRMVKAVDNLSLTIESGKLYGFLGPSGCGKSTSLFMISGIHDFTSGSLLFDGKDVTNFPPDKREVGMVFQNYALYPHLSVRENIEFPLVNSNSLTKKLKARAKERGIAFKNLIAEMVDSVAKIVEIGQLMDRKPSELSGGQQQRVAIARALVKEPSILLLDEPLSNLDARLRLQTREEIRKIQKRTGITTVFVTHDQDEAMNICDEIAIMREGRLQQTGKPQEVYDRPCNLFVAKFLGSFPINVLNGRVKNNELYIGNTAIRHVEIPDGDYSVGIRPENIVQSVEGDFKLRVVSDERHGGVELISGETDDGQRLSAVRNLALPLSVGAAECFSIKKDGVIVFDSDERRIFQC